MPTKPGDSGSMPFGIAAWNVVGRGRTPSEAVLSAGGEVADDGVRDHRGVGDRDQKRCLASLPVGRTGDRHGRAAMTTGRPARGRPLLLRPGLLPPAARGHHPGCHGRPHDPKTPISTRRRRGPSNSQRYTPCQVPSAGRPSMIGTMAEKPMMDALRCASELPSACR